MVVNTIGQEIIGRKKRFFRQNSNHPTNEVGIPCILPQEQERVPEKLADQEVELVEAEGIDAAPLAPDGDDERLEVAQGEGEPQGLD